MVIKLNEKQKEIVIDFIDNGTEGYELVKYFGTYDRKEVMRMDLEINNENVRKNFNGWWNLLVNGKIETMLNFLVYKRVLRKTKALG